MFKFALLALLSLLVTVKCDAGVPTFPNVGYLGAGYDLMYGNPQTPGHVDPGFRSRVFNLTLYHGDLTPVQRYQVPVGTEIVNCTACSLSFGSQKIDSAYDYAKHLATGVSADFAGWGAKFSASAAYQSVSTATSSSTNSYTSASAECNVYCASIKMYNAPPLTLNFVNAIKQLPATLQDCTCGNGCAPCVQKYAQSFIKCGDAPALMNDTSRRHFLSLHRHQTEN
jgi:hypothetical protein